MWCKGLVWSPRNVKGERENHLHKVVQWSPQACHLCLSFSPPTNNNDDDEEEDNNNLWRKQWMSVFWSNSMGLIFWESERIHFMVLLLLNQKCRFGIGFKSLHHSWRDGSTVKRTCCSSWGPRFYAQHWHGCSQQSVNLVLGESNALSCLHIHQIC